VAGPRETESVCGHCRRRGDTGLPLSQAAAKDYGSRFAVVFAQSSVAIGAGKVSFGIHHSACPSLLSSPAEYESADRHGLIPAHGGLPCPPDGHNASLHLRGATRFFEPGPDPGLRLLPDGEAGQLNGIPLDLIFAPTFTPDGTHVAYSAVRSSTGRDLEHLDRSIHHRGRGGEAAARMRPRLSFIGPHNGDVPYLRIQDRLAPGHRDPSRERSPSQTPTRDLSTKSRARNGALLPILFLPIVNSVLGSRNGPETANWQRLSPCAIRTGRLARPVPVRGPRPVPCLFPRPWSPSGDWMYFLFSVQILPVIGHLLAPALPQTGQPSADHGSDPPDEETVACAPRIGRSFFCWTLARAWKQSTIWLAWPPAAKRVLNDREVMRTRPFALL